MSQRSLRFPPTMQSLQALRAIAALLVVVFHAGLRVDQSEQTFRIGNAGVDIFFVISGFVMHMVTTRRWVDAATFLRHRAIRLVPMYWLITLLMVAGWAVLPSAFPHTHPTVRHVLLSLAFVPHQSPDVGLAQPVLGQGWTLNFEVFFYLIFAAALALPSLRPATRRIAALAAVLVILPAIGLALRTPAVPVTDLLSPLLLEFLGGILLAQWFLHLPHPGAWWCRLAVAAGAALLLMAAPAAGDDAARVLQYGVPAVLIVGGLLGLERAGHLRVPRPLRWLGDASYSIYLTHTLAIAALGKLWPAQWPVWTFLGAATVFAALAGGGVYLALERPLLARMRLIEERKRFFFEKKNQKTFTPDRSAL